MRRAHDKVLKFSRVMQRFLLRLQNNKREHNDSVSTMSVEVPSRTIETKQSNDKCAGPSIQSLSENDLDALIERIAEAKEHNLVLSVADYDVLLNAIMTLANMQERLSHNELTQSRMKKLLGMVGSSEKLKHLRPTEPGSIKPAAKKADQIKPA